MKSKNPFNYKVTIRLSEENKHFIDWLLKQWGPGGYQKGSHWNINFNNSWQNNGDPMTVAFRSSEDATAFALKWA